MRKNTILFWQCRLRDTYLASPWRCWRSFYVVREGHFMLSMKVILCCPWRLGLNKEVRMLKVCETRCCDLGRDHEYSCALGEPVSSRAFMHLRAKWRRWSRHCPRLKKNHQRCLGSECQKLVCHFAGAFKKLTVWNGTRLQITNILRQYHI